MVTSFHLIQKLQIIFNLKVSVIVEFHKDSSKVFLYFPGRIRNSPEPADEDDNESCVLSLGLFPGEPLELPGDDRAMFR